MKVLQRCIPLLVNYPLCFTVMDFQMDISRKHVPVSSQLRCWELQTGHFRSVRASLCSTRAVIIPGFTDMCCWSALLPSSDAETRCHADARADSCVHTTRWRGRCRAPRCCHPAAAMPAWVIWPTRGVANEQCTHFK